jgi:N utilization substance protein B
MGTRRKSRECSLKMLYMFDNCKLSTKDIYEFFDNYLLVGKPYRTFAISLFNGVYKNKKKIDYFISLYTENWEINRIAVVDRNIIRIAIYEIMINKDTPVDVIIDEAIEISKKYSTENSYKFINGILNKLKFARKS